MKSLMLASLALCAIVSTGNVQAREVNELDKVTQFQYMRDPRTNICFVFNANGGEFAVVDCNKIPAALLTDEQNNDE
jgi:hypothetical protein